MNTLFTGNNFLELSSLDSTNDYAKSILSGKPPEGTVVFTHHQTQGKGQRKNIWLSEKGENITVSIIYYPRFLLPRSLFELNMMVSVSIIRLLKKYVKEEIWIKWPNDILIGTKKICGILIENTVGRTQVQSSIIGIGLNVNQLEFPDEIKNRTCSLRMITGQELDLKLLLAELLKEIEAEYLKLRSGKNDLLLGNYKNNLWGFKQKSLFQIGKDKSTFYFEEIDSFGRLGIRVDNDIKYFSMDEIKMLR